MVNSAGTGGTEATDSGHRTRIACRQGGGLARGTEGFGNLLLLLGRVGM